MTRTLFLNLPLRVNLPFYGAAILLGLGLGGLVFVFQPIYLVFLMGGIFFAYLLLVKIDVAIILALFLQNILGRFNYLGGGTPLHPNGIMGFAIIAGTLFHFLFNKTGKGDFRKISLFLLFFLLCIASIALTPREYLMESITVTLRLATSLSIFAVLLFKLNSIQETKWVLAAVLAAQVIPTLSGLFTYAGKTGISFSADTLRLGDSGVGVYLAMILTVCLVFLLDAKTIRAQLLWGSLSVLYLLALYFSFGRAGWISFVFAMLVVGFLKHKWLLIVTPLLLVITFLLVSGVTERFSDISIGNPASGTSTFAYRVMIWQAALQIYADHPLFGVGIGAGRYLVGERLNHYSWMIHNDYICVLLETGLLGFSLFVAWQVQWLKSLFDVFRGSVHPYDKTLALAVFAMFVTLLIARATDNILLDSYDMYPMCALIATVFALPRIRAKTENNSA